MYDFLNFKLLIMFAVRIGKPISTEAPARLKSAPNK